MIFEYKTLKNVNIIFINYYLIWYLKKHLVMSSNGKRALLRPNDPPCRRSSSVGSQQAQPMRCCCFLFFFFSEFFLSNDYKLKTQANQCLQHLIFTPLHILLFTHYLLFLPRHSSTLTQFLFSRMILFQKITTSYQKVSG